MTQNTGRGAQYLSNAIDDYYQYNPDTLMPLLMLALATQGRLSIENDPSSGIVFASIDIEKVGEYEWVKLNPALKKRLKEERAAGVKVIAAVGDIPEDLKDIYGIFHEYDTKTVVLEYHHRKGILVQHSSNQDSEKAQRQYATLLFAEELTAAPQDWLQRKFLQIANTILVESGIQPRRPRIRVAQALCALLDYDGVGVLYNPFAGCALAAAMVGAGENLYADGDTNDKLLAAAKLLCYGTGQKGCNVEQRDSTKWLQGVKADYVMSTFLGYPGGKSAFDICLGHCLNDFKDSGKFAGIAAPKDIFEKRSEEMTEALNRDWVDSIVLLPFGEVAILIDAAKPAERKRHVRFYNMTHPMIARRPVSRVIGNDDYADILKLSDVKKKGFLKSLVIPEIEQQDGCEIITLGDIYEKVPRKTWSLTNIPEYKKVMVVIDRDKPYNQWEGLWMNGLGKKPIVSLFAPAYKLNQDCLVVNSRGPLEPRLFDSDQGEAFFQDGLAFRSKLFFAGEDYEWLIQELCKPYVEHQLHPYGVDEMLPETITEDQVLSLKLNRPLMEDEPMEEDKDADKLPFGTVLKGEKMVYTIHKFLGHGFFGYTYTANARNKATGEDKEVVLKEFYPWKYFRRDGIKACLKNPDETVFREENSRKFIEEAKIMNRLGLTPDSHIVPAYEYFHSEETDTDYYVMPFYNDGSLEDLQISGFNFSEDMLINHVVIPMCKALNVAHKSKVLHLDIKPENILVDESGDAVLIDFGVAKQYDDADNVISREGLTSSSMFAAPELQARGGMVHFGEQPDIYGVASTLYYLATECEPPHPIMDLSEQDQDIRGNLRNYRFSDQFADAIVAGLQFSASSRPRNAQAFLKLFPGCEDIKL